MDYVTFVKKKLNEQFMMSDLGPLSYFLGIKVHSDGDSYYLSQDRYVQDLLARPGPWSALVLAFHSTQTCLLETASQQCSNHTGFGCNPAYLYCVVADDKDGQNTFLQNACLPSSPPNNLPDPLFGIYVPALQNVSQSTSFFAKLFYCIWWGLQNLSSLGQNLKTSTYAGENLFAVFVSISGLVLLIVPTYLQSAYLRREEMRVKSRDTDQWMSYRLLPENLKERIRRHEQYRWQETSGVDEELLLTNLPKDLRRAIKRHLCLSLVTRVPMFENMDDQLLNAMCDRLKPVLYTEGSCISREGYPVNEMRFIKRGNVMSMTTIGGRTGFFNSVVLKGGDFCGEELLTCGLLTPHQRPASRAQPGQ